MIAAIPQTVPASPSAGGAKSQSASSAGNENAVFGGILENLMTLLTGSSAAPSGGKGQVPLSLHDWLAQQGDGDPGKQEDGQNQSAQAIAMASMLPAIFPAQMHTVSDSATTATAANPSAAMAMLPDAHPALAPAQQPNTQAPGVLPQPLPEQLSASAQASPAAPADVAAHNPVDTQATELPADFTLVLQQAVGEDQISAPARPSKPDKGGEELQLRKAEQVSQQEGTEIPSAAAAAQTDPLSPQPEDSRIQPAPSVKKGSKPIEEPGAPAKTETVLRPAVSDPVKVSAAESSQPSQQAEAAPPSFQIAEKVTQAIHDGTGSFQMKLYPEGLGEVHVTLHCQDGKVSLDILTSSVATQKLLETQAPDLKSALESKNYEMSSFHVAAQSGGNLSFGSGFAFFSDSRSGQNLRQEFYRGSDGASPLKDVRTAPVRREMNTGLVNYRI